MKRTLLTAAIAATAILPLSAAQAQDIKLGHVLAPTHSWNIAAEGFAKDVAEATDGRVNFQVFPSGQLGNEKTVVEGMQIGSVPAGVIGCGSFQPLDARFGIVELPYSWPDREHAYAAYDGKLGDALEDRYAGFDIGLIKAGRVVGWRGELERQAAAAGEAWKPSQTAA